MGSQPFGGEGLSGTGPKAGGARYLQRFSRVAPVLTHNAWQGGCDVKVLQDKIDKTQAGHLIAQEFLPGPTGEDNRLRLMAKGAILCLGPSDTIAAQQVKAVQNLGGVAVMADGDLPPDALLHLQGFYGVIYWGYDAKPYAEALSQRDGAIIPLICAMPDIAHVAHERHICVDTTASGGNAALLAG